MRNLQESSFQPGHARGPDLTYRDTVEISGAIDPKQLRNFAKKRRSRAMGPTTIFYAGVTAPAVSAGMAGLSHWGLTYSSLPPFWQWYTATLLAALTGVIWYTLFMRLGSRGGFGRGGETASETHVVISDAGVEVTRGHVQTRIDWTGVSDIAISADYVALIVQDSNDVLMPADWFGGREAMKDAAAKICALRPPPFAG